MCINPNNNPFLIIPIKYIKIFRIKSNQRLYLGTTHFVFLHKVNVGCPLDFHRLPLPIVQRQHKVEEVGFAQVGGRLLLVVSSGQTDTAVQR